MDINPSAAAGSESDSASPSTSPSEPEQTNLTEDDLAVSRAYDRRLKRAMTRQARTASLLILIYGLAQAICILPGALRVATEFAPVEGTLLVLCVFSLLGMSWWALRRPWPASLIAMAVFGLLESLGLAWSEYPTDGLLGRVLLFLLMAKAVHSGFHHRRLKRQLRSDPDAVPLEG